MSSVCRLREGGGGRGWGGRIRRATSPGDIACFSGALFRLGAVFGTLVLIHIKACVAFCTHRMYLAQCEGSVDVVGRRQTCDFHPYLCTQCVSRCQAWCTESAADFDGDIVF